MAQKKIKMAVIGCGGIANGVHFPAYQKLDTVELVAVCDIKVEKAKELLKSLEFLPFMRTITRCSK